MRVKVDETGVIVEADDFEAVNSSLEENVTPGTWRFVRRAIARVCGTGEPEAVICCLKQATIGFHQLQLTPADGLVAVDAEVVLDESPDVLLQRMLGQSEDGEYIVTLIAPDGSQAQEYTAQERQEAIAWVAEYLNEPLGMAPAIYPPGVQPVI